jgi:hypothetical protein
LEPFFSGYGIFDPALLHQIGDVINVGARIAFIPGAIQTNDQPARESVVVGGIQFWLRSFGLPPRK